ncbi:acyltransferase family protein [Pseudonocardia sp. GCM10023141]|uniref:acyltransferase family protein n=1 Tax=Pseudonocardia sp. GCM10023141 TaxID=3252653 RepID=UPI00360EC65E
MTIARPQTTPSGTQAATSGEFRGLTGLRIVAAAWVVLFHFHFTPLPWVAEVTSALGPLVTSGALGVDLFFVLSGFVIAHTYLDRLGPALRVRAAARFVWARAARIWPAYAVVFNLFGMWLVARLLLGSEKNVAFQSVQPEFSVKAWVEQLFMVQLWDKPFFDGASWVGATWSISAEWLAYLLFPVAALLFFRLRRLPVGVLLLGAVALMAPIAWSYLSTGNPYYEWSWLIRILCGFGAGVLVQLAVRKLRWTSDLRRRASVAAVAIPLLIAAGLVLGEFAGEGRGGVVILLFPLLVGALALADRGPAMLLSMPWAVAGGRLSYSLYLVHIPMFEMYWWALRRFAWFGTHTMMAHLLGLAVLLSTIGVAAVLHRMVEEPAQTALRQVHLPRFHRSAPVTVSPPEPRSAADAMTPAAMTAAASAADPVAAVHAHRAELLTEPRHAVSAQRRSTLASVLVNAQRRRPTHRADLMADLERAEYVRAGYLHAGS